MKKFTFEGAIIPNKHYHMDFSHQIRDLEKAERAKKPTLVLFPSKSGKSTLLENYYQSKLTSKENNPFLFNFTTYSRTDFSTLEKFVDRFKRDLVENAGKINDQILRFCEGISISTIGEFSEAIDELLSLLGANKILIIDDIDKSLIHDPVAQFLGMILKKYVGAQSRVSNSFDFIVCSGIKKIDGFKPFERGLDDRDFFTTWSENLSYSNCLKMDHDLVKNYTENYCKEISFEMEENVPDELLESSQGRISNINKLLKFYDEKVRVYKKQKILTSAEIKHAAGYVMVSTPY